MSQIKKIIINFLYTFIFLFSFIGIFYTIKTKNQELSYYSSVFNKIKYKKVQIKINRIIFTLYERSQKKQNIFLNKLKKLNIKIIHINQTNKFVSITFQPNQKQPKLNNREIKTFYF